MSNFWDADHGEQLRGVEVCFRPEIIISRVQRTCYRTAVLQEPLPVARGRIFGDGCANREYYAGAGFRANRRERTSGPDEGGGTAKQ